jgi:hypothetical protein
MRVTPRHAALVFAVAAAVFTGKTALASPSAKLVYVRGAGAETCPGESELRKAVAVRIGYDPFFPVAQKTVVAQVQRVPKGYRGKVQIVGDDGNVRGERELSTTGEDCGELVGALALAVSIALDDLDEAPPAPPSAKPAPEEPVTPVPLPPPPPAEPPPVRPPPKTTPSSLDLAMSLGPTVSLGTAPDAAAGASFATALRWTSFSVRLDVRGELPASKAMPQGGRVATNVVVAMASACLRGRVPFVCLGGGPGVLFSSTENITRTATDRASLLVGALRGGADIALGSRLYLEPFVELGASLLVRRIAVDGRTVHETAPLWGVLGLHLGGRIL